VWTPTKDDRSTIPALTSGLECWSYFPSAPIGVVLLFHGSGGNGSGWFSKVEDARLMADAVAAGFGVVALDSQDRINKQWDNTVSASNGDVHNLLEVLAVFVSRGDIT